MKKLIVILVGIFILFSANGSRDANIKAPQHIAGSYYKLFPMHDICPNSIHFGANLRNPNDVGLTRSFEILENVNNGELEFLGRFDGGEKCSGNLTGTQGPDVNLMIHKMRNDRGYNISREHKAWLIEAKRSTEYGEMIYNEECLVDGIVNSMNGAFMNSTIFYELKILNAVDLMEWARVVDKSEKLLITRIWDDDKEMVTICGYADESLGIQKLDEKVLVGEEKTAKAEAANMRELVMKLFYLWTN